MRKLAYADLLADRDRLAREACLYQKALHVERSESASARETFTINNQRFTLRLFRCTAPHGGIVIEYSSILGQTPSTHAYYLDDLILDYQNAKHGSLMLAYAIAVEHLSTARNRMLDTYHLTIA